MSNRIDDQATVAAGSVAIKAVNYIAASLGIGTFLGLVNVVVGVLSALWLGFQIYGYVVHELPMKRMRKQILKRQLERNQTQPAELGALGVDE